MTTTRGGRPIPPTGPTWPTPHCGAWRRCWLDRATHRPAPAARGLLLPLVRLPGAAVGRVHRPPRRHRARVRMGPRAALDRHVAALPGGRPEAPDPALAGGGGGRHRGHRTVRRIGWVRGGAQTLA